MYAGSWQILLFYNQRKIFGDIDNLMSNANSEEITKKEAESPVLRGYKRQIDTKKRLYKCVTSDKFKNSPYYHKTIVDEKREMAENRTWICHHTNTEALLKIMSNKTFRFSRIDQVNDLSEKDLYSIDNLYMGTYIACFNHN